MAYTQNMNTEWCQHEVTGKESTLRASGFLDPERPSRITACVLYACMRSRGYEAVPLWLHALGCNVPMMRERGPTAPRPCAQLPDDCAPQPLTAGGSR